MESLILFLAHSMVTLIGIFHKVTHTYWIDIILLTLTVRLVVNPINRKQTQTMKVMNEIQPELKALQEKYKNTPKDTAEDKQRKAQEQQKSMMELYKRHNVNPFMGCFPMLIQMPILISLFWVLRASRFYDLLPGFRQATMFGAKLTVCPFESAPFPDIESLPGMVDLSSIIHTPFLLDKFIYLPALPLLILYLGTTILQTRQMQVKNPQGQSSNHMNMMMPLFLYFGLIFPVGLLLYFALSNLFQMQQYASIKKIDHKTGAVESMAGQESGEGSTPSPPPPKKRKKKRRK